MVNVGSSIRMYFIVLSSISMFSCKREFGNNKWFGYVMQCGQGSTDDELSPTCVSSLLGIRIEGVAAGLWHTVCISADGDVYAFGGNQFGQLGTGADQAEVHPQHSSLDTEDCVDVLC